jgi:hypothetical protein
MMKRSSWFSIALATTLLLIFPAITVLANHYYRYNKDEVRQIGWRTGYELGLREGQRDWRLGFRFDYKESQAYKDGKIGYRDEYRHDGHYKKGFREGFEVGYRDGYYGYGWRGDYRRPRRGDLGYDDRYDNCEIGPRSRRY